MQKKSDEISLHDRESKKKYLNLREKAEKLFQKEKFGSARHHFAEAYQICPSEEVQERIRACEESADRVAQAQELLKQGYKLEREKKLREALKVFDQSLSIWENKEIRILVTKLRSKLPKPSLSPAYRAEAERRYTEAVEQYREVLELEANPEVRARLGICLVKQKAYAEAVTFLESSPSNDPEAQYYAGYALAKLGRYSEALRRWETITQEQPELTQQKEELLKIAIGDLLRRQQFNSKFDSAYQEALNLLKDYPSPLLKKVVRSMSLSYLEKLWSKEKFNDMLNFLLSMEAETKAETKAEMETGTEAGEKAGKEAGEETGKEIGEFLPLIMAKVYFRLAETAVKYLPEAITFWLTVIYNPRYLSSPAHPALTEQQILPSGQSQLTPAGQSQLTGDLQQRLERLVQQYKTGRRYKEMEEILTHWEMEKQSIEFLQEIARSEPAFVDLLCTPAFAMRFGWSSLILKKLQGVKSRWENDERFWITGALFSPARNSFLLLRQGKIEEATAALPSRKEDEFADYCRQKIFFRLGVQKLKKGEPNLKKYFTQAIPLIIRFKEYEKEIIGLAQKTGKNLKELVSLDDVLQMLIRHLKSRELLEITSYIMSYKANVLYNERLIKHQEVERICKKALELYPDNEFAKNGLKTFQTGHFMQELNRAVRKGNIKKAANITIEAENDDIEEAFFDFADTALEELDSAPIDREMKISFLRELYHQCERVDPDAPVLDDIADELEDLEEEVSR